ncbi:MAG: tetratricopeptide repeat protein, partial [Deltaproteobacteria bacterium]|nr:tetratricopeptide repeat protein [Deltaproteobacteria bacterium]
AHNNLAVAYYYHGDYDLSLDHLEKAKKIGYAVSPQFAEMVSAKAKSQTKEAS